MGSAADAVYSNFWKQLGVGNWEDERQLLLIHQHISMKVNEYHMRQLWARKGIIEGFSGDSNEVKQT